MPSFDDNPRAALPEDGPLILFPRACDPLPCLKVLMGLGAPDAETTITIDGLPPFLAVSDHQGRWCAQNPYDLSPGRHRVSVSQARQDRAAAVEFTVRPCPPPPAPILLSPGKEEVIDARRPFLSGRASPENQVTVCLAGFGCLSAGAGCDGIFSVRFPMPLPDGEHVATAVQADACGKVSCAGQNRFYVRGKLPLPPPTIDVPPNGAVIFENRPLISGQALPFYTVTVCLGPLGCLETQAGETGNYGVRFEAELADGSYTVTATQRDGRGNQSPPAQSSFTLRGEEPLPPPVIEAPPHGAVLSDPRPLISGRALPHNQVDVCLEGRGCLNAPADEAGDFAVRFPGELTDGSYLVTALQRDAAGRQSPAAESVFAVRLPAPPPPPVILSPADGAVVPDRRPLISGLAEEGNDVRVCLDSACLSAPAAQDGRFEARFSLDLGDGVHTVTATQQDPQGRVSAPAQSTFTVEAPGPLPPPIIDTPADGSTIQNPTPFITGRAIPGLTVRICLDNGQCRESAADPFGLFSVRFPSPLPDGSYTVKAIQYDSRQVSPTAISTFRVASGTLTLTPLELRTGSSFRRVEIRFLLTGGPADATVFYLLTAPDAPAPTPEQVKNPDPAALGDGRAARGSFRVRLTGEPQTVVRALCGRETAAPLPEETGAVDGLRYRAYLWVETETGRCSGVEAFAGSALAMPFDGGDGSPESPYRLRPLDLSGPDACPDLLPGHPLNDAGVSRAARMLENIERLAVLYDGTGGVHGSRDSLSRAYRLAGSFDLAAYSDAYGGDGWRPIGNRDDPLGGLGPTGRHCFTGILLGEGGALSNLSLTPRRRADRPVSAVGLFGCARGAKIENLSLSAVTLAPRVSPELLTLRCGALAGYAKGCTLRDLKISNLTASFGGFGAPGSTLFFGGLAGDILDGSLCGVLLTNIAVTNPTAAFNCCGGCAGRAAAERELSLTGCDVRLFEAQGAPGADLCAGGVAGLLSPRGRCGVCRCAVTGARIRGDRCTGGGVAGRLSATGGPVTLGEVYVLGPDIRSETGGFPVGGVIGFAGCAAPLRLSSADVSAGLLRASREAGGVIGLMRLHKGGRADLGYLLVSADISAHGSCAGGVLGRLHREEGAGFHLHDAEVSPSTRVEGGANAGGLCGELFHPAQSAPLFIERCRVSAAVTGGGPGENRGGLAGLCSFCAFGRCRFDGSVEGVRQVGGLIGAGAGICLTDCACDAPVSGSVRVGGLAGAVRGAQSPAPPPNPPFSVRQNHILRCSARGRLSCPAEGGEMGGLCGLLDGATLSESFCLMEFSQQNLSNLGGLCGGVYLSGGPDSVISDCYCTGSAARAGGNVGGVAGSSCGRILRCYSAGSFTGRGMAGGIAGANTGDSGHPVAGCFALGALAGAEAESAARVQNGAGARRENYALEGMSLIKGGAAAVPLSDPDGADGEDLPAALIPLRMREAGWSDEVWDFSSIRRLGRPTLRNNPEE